MNTNDKNIIANPELNSENFEVFNFDELNGIINGTADSDNKIKGVSLGFRCCNSEEDEEDEDDRKG